MTDIRIRTIEGEERALGRSDLDALANALQGPVVTPDDDDYDEVRAIWNAMIDRRPALIARCHQPEDVAHAVRFARERDLLVTVRGAGHNIAGNAVADGALMIDLSPMKDVVVDTGARTARAAGGATLGDLDRATQAHGLATPVGINSTTGIAGLTLGGGWGWLSRVHGATADNLRGADVVTADGGTVRASDEENPDLFWGLRGGGGNFGVVAAFDFDLHPVGPEVLSGLVVHPYEAAPEVLRMFRDVAAELPREASVWAVLRKAPPLPFLPDEVHGSPVVILACFHLGDMAEGERLLEPVRSFGEPIADVVGPHAYADWQAAFDPLLEPGARNYWKSHNFVELPDAALDTLVEYEATLPTLLSEIFLARLGGAINDLAPDATAYPHRDVEFVLNVHTRWEDPADDARCVAWAREFYAASEPFATGGAYVNFMPEDEMGRTEGAYGSNAGRLAEVKGRWDPDNFFRKNQNVQPAAATA